MILKLENQIPMKNFPIGFIAKFRFTWITFLTEPGAEQLLELFNLKNLISFIQVHRNSFVSAIRRCKFSEQIHRKRQRDGKRNTVSTAVLATNINRIIGFCPSVNFNFLRIIEFHRQVREIDAKALLSPCFAIKSAE